MGWFPQSFLLNVALENTRCGRAAGPLAASQHALCDGPRRTVGIGARVLRRQTGSGSTRGSMWGPLRGAGWRDTQTRR